MDQFSSLFYQVRAMHCPYCIAHDTRVIDSRLASDGYQVKRRRECSVCKERFTTYEIAELSLPKIIKRDGGIEQFSEEKLRAGMQRALEKRPVKTEAIEIAISRIKKNMTARVDRDISADQLGELVMQELKLLDQVAYVRFASVYLSFQDISEFTQMIEGLKK